MGNSDYAEQLTLWAETPATAMAHVMAPGAASGVAPGATPAATQADPPRMERAYPPIIGLVGAARAGKTTAAYHLAARAGYWMVSFADALRFAARNANPIIGEGEIRWRDAEMLYGYQAMKARYPEVRRFLQALGVAMRMIDEDTWILALSDTIERIRGRTGAGRHGRFVIDDVRFQNEAEYLRSRGGVLVRITRPGAPALPESAARHVSETEHQNICVSHTVENNGTILDLYAKLNGVLDAEFRPRVQI